MKGTVWTIFVSLGFVLLIAVQAYPRNYVAALNSMQVIPFSASVGHGSCKVAVINDGWGYTYLNANCDFSGLSGGLIDADIRNGAAGLNGSTACYEGRTVTVTLPNNGSGNVAISCRVFDEWPFFQKQAYVALETSNYQSGEIRGQIKPMTLDLDVDGEGRAEVSIFRPADSTSYAYCSMLNSAIIQPLNWQAETDSTPFLADFDGDGIADWAFVRINSADGQMTIVYRKSTNHILVYIPWGNTNYGDRLVFGDYNGDGRMDAASFRPLNGIWYILEDFENLYNVHYEYWGQSGDRPCTGDYDGDGIADPCVIREEGGQLVWYVHASLGGIAPRVVWGLSTDETFESPADVDADSNSDVLVSRVENGLRYFYALRSYDRSMFFLQWGLSSDAIKIGDYDADGKTDVAAIREINGQLVWYIYQSSNGQLRVEYWGLPGDR